MQHLFSFDAAKGRTLSSQKIQKRDKTDFSNAVWPRNWKTEDDDDQSVRVRMSVFRSAFCYRVGLHGVKRGRQERGKKWGHFWLSISNRQATKAHTHLLETHSTAQQRSWLLCARHSRTHPCVLNSYPLLTPASNSVCLSCRQGSVSVLVSFPSRQIWRSANTARFPLCAPHTTIVRRDTSELNRLQLQYEQHAALLYCSNTDVAFPSF